MRAWPLSPSFCVHVTLYRTGKDSLANSLQQNLTHPGFFLSLETRSAIPSHPPLPLSSCPGTLPEKKPGVTELIWRESKQPEACHSVLIPGACRAVLLMFASSTTHLVSGSSLGCPWSTSRSLLVCKQLRRVTMAPFCIFRVPSLQVCACVCL